MSRRECAFVGSLERVATDDRRPVHREREDAERYEQADHTRQHDRLHHADHADLPADPQHRRRHVANHGPRSARVRRDHNHPDEQLAAIVGDQFLQQRHHHDRAGQVVEHGGHHERKPRRDPHQLHLVRGVDPVGDDLEAVVVVDDLDDRHRPEQEEQNLADLAEQVPKLPLDHVLAGQFDPFEMMPAGGVRLVVLFAPFAASVGIIGGIEQAGLSRFLDRCNLSRLERGKPAGHNAGRCDRPDVHRVDRPNDDREHEGRGGLVDVQRVFEGDRQVADHEHDKNGEQRG